MTVFVTRGDAPLDDAQLGARTLAYIDRDWPEWRRQRSIRKEDDTFNSYMVGVSADTDTNRANNAFNLELAAYRAAVARLAQVRLADGRPAVIGEGPAGEPIELFAAIDPVPADDPAIERDEAERADAQAVIDAASTDVAEFQSEGE